MVQLERFLINSYVLYLVLMLCTLSFDKSERVMIVIPSLNINSSSAHITHQQDRLYFEGQLYSGYIFGLYEDGDTSFITSFFKGKEQGKSETWYPNGQCMEIRLFDCGKKIGRHCGWWENGKIKFEMNYKADLFEGNQREWNEQGRLFKDCNYKEGYESGAQKYWRPNGALYANYVVRNGRNYGLTGVKNCSNVGDSISR